MDLRGVRIRVVALHEALAASVQQASAPLERHTGALEAEPGRAGVGAEELHVGEAYALVVGEPEAIAGGSIGTDVVAAKKLQSAVASSTARAAKDGSAVVRSRPTAPATRPSLRRRSVTKTRGCCLMPARIAWRRSASMTAEPPTRSRKRGTTIILTCSRPRDGMRV